MVDLSIVTSVFGDYGKYLPQWTRSVCDLNGKPSSVTVCISGSCDAEQIWDEKCASVFDAAGIPWKLVILSEHQGMGRARNEAVRHTWSEWIMHLDVDDLVLPHCLDDVADLASQADVVVVGIEFSSYRNKEGSRLFSHASSAASLAGRHVSTSLSPYRRRLWVKQPYIEQNDYIDQALWVGFAHQGARFVATSRPCVVYMIRKDGHFASLAKTEKLAARQQLARLRRDKSLFLSLSLCEKEQIPTIKESTK